MSCDYQSDLDELRSLVPDETTAEDYTDTDKNLVVTESVLIDGEEILGQYRETLNVDVDDDTEENTDQNTVLIRNICSYGITSEMQSF